jgi:hypothetical protein
VRLVCCLPFVRRYRDLGNNQLSGSIPPSVGSLTAMTCLCVWRRSYGLPHENAERRMCTAALSRTSDSIPRALLLPLLMRRMCAAAVSRTGRSVSRALQVRVLLVLLYLVASELCVLSAACVLFVATGSLPTTSFREASPPA